MDIKVTPAAQKFMSRMVRFGSHGAGAGFRLQVSAGGCSGLASEFTVESAPKEGDACLEMGALKVFLPAESRLLLEGVTVDFRDTPMQSGLTFLNPKAGACGCSSGAEDGAPRAAAVSVAAIQRRS